ncbi:flagellar export protein FliJ [Paenibacillus crassostreae]|uniref:Flagellar FliJ protein n=1 Tax=Paenibacillus crassostreae TaxID=1763538 RepID=A0A167FNK8_9BACL|nr:flagellar export protein FliJ [Paenibacillus crassostreae]AOZ94221.1 flagellar export protein FliJ [Paenibacillus crassostreae]OAB76743.1 flagellar export protein FliJ [Paenibacillus crassostreae]
MIFNYTFQNIVNLKGNERTQAEWMLSSALVKLQEEEQTLIELEKFRNDTTEQLLLKIENSASIVKIQELQTYLEYLEQCIVRKNSDVRKANVAVRKSQNHLSDKMLDEKVWLKSRDKAKDKFQHETLLREQNELDEIATVRFAMNLR